jgi:hypothetical protein
MWISPRTPNRSAQGDQPQLSESAAAPGSASKGANEEHGAQGDGQEYAVEASEDHHPGEHAERQRTEHPGPLEHLRTIAEREQRHDEQDLDCGLHAVDRREEHQREQERAASEPRQRAIEQEGRDREEHALQHEPGEEARLQRERQPLDRDEQIEPQWLIAVRRVDLIEGEAVSPGDVFGDTGEVARIVERLRDQPVGREGQELDHSPERNDRQQSAGRPIHLEVPPGPSVVCDEADARGSPPQTHGKQRADRLDTRRIYSTLRAAQDTVGLHHGPVRPHLDDS